MKQVKVLGTGCPKCKKLAEMVTKISSDNNIDVTVVKITDMNEIVKYGVMMTPGLVIDEKVVLSGKLPSEHELKTLLAY